MADTYTKLIYHIIFSTKGREPLITPRLREVLYPYIEGILQGQEAHLMELGGMPDHLHIVLRVKSDLSISEVVRLVKANSSKWVNEQGPAGTIGAFGWQRGYAAFSVSFSQLPSLCAYVRAQEEHHRARSFQEEYVGFLTRHEIEFDNKQI